MNPALKSPVPEREREPAGDIPCREDESTSITATWNERVEASFLAALDRPPTERDAFLADQCAADEQLRIRVQRLLSAYERGGELLEGSPEVEQELACLRSEAAGDYIGAYRLVRQIGEGGFGVIWLADQERPVKRQVAIKIVKMGMDTREVVARFEQERQALAMMDHPHIARVLDGGVTPNGRPYFVMDFVDGVKLTEFCDLERLSIDDRLRVLIAICHAVQHAHQKGIIHRDLKPSNILVTRQDGTPLPKVIDFGVAKALEQRLTENTFHTQAEQIVGTPLYMSPEQAGSTGLDVDTRSDIYSLGVLLYELLTGATPFAVVEGKQKNIEAVRRFLREQEPLWPAEAYNHLEPKRREKAAAQRRTDSRRLPRELGGDLGWITMKALEKDRERRYDTAGALAADLERHMKHEAVLARPPSRMYRLRRFARRHKAGVLAGGAVALALILGLVVSLTLLDSLRATLAKLSATAPAFAAAARELNGNGELAAAIEKLDAAIDLQPGNPEYWLQRAALRRALDRLEEAAADYRHALALSPGESRALEGLTLCERMLANPRDSDGSLSRETLLALFQAMKAESRPAAEQVALAEKLGKKHEIALATWVEHLKPLPNASERPIEERLKFDSSGGLTLDLSGTGVSDLARLRGMPLAGLEVNDCVDLKSIEALRGMPLRTLRLDNTAVEDLSPLAGMKTLQDLSVHTTKVRDLTPLRGLTGLERLRASKSPVADISALRDLSSLKRLEINTTAIEDLTPLVGLGIKMLDVCYTNVGNCGALAGLRSLETVWLQGLPEVDLEFARGLPLREVSLIGVRKLTNLNALAAVTTLEVLTLPRAFMAAEDQTSIKAIADPSISAEVNSVGLLRTHPRLRRISCRLTGEAGSQINDAENAEEFWVQWQRNLVIRRCCETLSAAGLNGRISREVDGTWAFNLSRQTLSSLSIFDSAEFRGAEISRLDVSHSPAITDLGPLRSLPLKDLRIAHARVSDLSPLSEMSTLRELWIANTKVTDLRPIQRIPLKRLFMDKCEALYDVSPVKAINTLEEVVLPEVATPGSIEALKQMPNLRRISFTFHRATERAACETGAFWKWPHDLRWIASLRKQLEGRLPKALDQFALQTADGTWRILLDDLPIAALDVIRGAPVSELSLKGTGITDLRPLAGMPLRQLRLDDTPSGTDVAPLLSCIGLEDLVLPPDARGVEALRSPKLGKLRSISFTALGDGRADRAADRFWVEYSKY